MRTKETREYRQEISAAKSRKNGFKERTAPLRKGLLNAALDFYFVRTGLNHEPTVWRPQ